MDGSEQKCSVRSYRAENDYRVAFLIVGLLVIIWVNGYFLASDKPTGNLLTSLPMSAYSIYTLK